MTQNNLGTAYADLAGIEERAANLQRAVVAFEAALQYWTPQAAPLDYAMIQYNLALIYRDLAEDQDREQNLKRSIHALEETLRFWTPKTAPIDYADSNKSLGLRYEDLGDLPAAIACWREAETYYRKMDMSRSGRSDVGRDRRRRAAPERRCRRINSTASAQVPLGLSESGIASVLHNSTAGVFMARQQGLRCNNLCNFICFSLVLQALDLACFSPPRHVWRGGRGVRSGLPLQPVQCRLGLGVIVIEVNRLLVIV